MIVFSVLQPLEDVMRAILDFFHDTGHLTWAWKHAPEMKEIQKKYKGDRQKMNEELMKF